MIAKLSAGFAVGVLFLAPILAQDRAPADQPQPTLLSAAKLVYPKEAKDAGIGGRITVRVTVGESGEVLSVDNAESWVELCKGGKNDPRIAALRDAVVDSLKQAKFKAAVKNGKAVKTTVFLSSTFDPASEPSTSDAEKKVIEVGMVVSRALRLPRPEYPPSARPKRAGGPVPVRVVIDESGKVFTAEPVGGHPLLRAAAVDAACKAKFSPMEINGKPLWMSGVVVFNFMPD